jgi:hypothetical protein
LELEFLGGVPCEFGLVFFPAAIKPLKNAEVFNGFIRPLTSDELVELNQTLNMGFELVGILWKGCNFDDLRLGKHGEEKGVANSLNA